jgi:hypothetical protein
MIFIYHFIDTIYQKFCVSFKKPENTAEQQTDKNDIFILFFNFLVEVL